MPPSLQFLQEARKGSTTAAKEAVKGDPEILQKGLREGKWTVYETVCASLEIALETSEAGDNSGKLLLTHVMNNIEQ